MGQNNFILKLSMPVLLLTISTFSENCNAQSIILRPALGIRWYNAKPDYKSAHYFDPSYNGKFKFSEPAASIAFELLYAKHSFELVFTSQHASNGLVTHFKNAMVGTSYNSQTGFRQFQFHYHRFIEIKRSNKKSISVFAGMGTGIGINRPQSIYADTAFSVYRVYSLQFPDQYIDVDVRQKSLAKLSYSAIFKIGFALKIKNVERGRLQAVYNMGLNKIVESKTIYYHTNARYFGSSFSRGSQFSLMFSMPVYLKRKK
jgi:hypothetical protein